MRIADRKLRLRQTARMRAKYHRPSFGGAVRVGHRRLRQGSVQRRHQACADRRRAHAHESDAGEIGRRHQVVLAQHHGDHRRHCGEPGAAVASDRLDVGAARKTAAAARWWRAPRRRVSPAPVRSCDRAAPLSDNDGDRGRARAASRRPRCDSDATARRLWACRSNRRCRETSPAHPRPAPRRRTGHGRGRHQTAHRRSRAAISSGQSAARVASQNTSLAPASRRMKWIVSRGNLKLTGTATKPERMMP